MLVRKIEKEIRDYLLSDRQEILLISGARQIGKSYIVRYIGQQLFQNYIEIDMKADAQGARLFADATTTEMFYMRLSTIAGGRMQGRRDTLVFIDEIQAYPHLLTLLKFLRQDNRFQYIASGSLLGVTLSKAVSIPVGSLEELRMYPLDLEEFLWALGYGEYVLQDLRQRFERRESLDQTLHDKLMADFRRYLLVGGLPEAVNRYVAEKNIVSIRRVQNAIHDLYAADASKYDEDNRLKIRRIYDMVPSNLENKKKRVVIKDIEGKQGKRFSDYEDEFEYLIQSGTTLEVKAISAPRFPLCESSTKNLLKLYLNDVGVLSAILYGLNIDAILKDVPSINLGTLYESFVAQELRAHGFNLHYYDNKQHGEVDFLVDDYKTLSVLPVEVKSGKDYTVHSALNHFVSCADYKIQQGLVVSNEREISWQGKICHVPIYYVMFLEPEPVASVTF
ncbi:MAG: AAA family ATPase [Bacteroidales bacterium]|nr:AAA family ATPase [Bacteroidales bacterium]